MTILDFRRWLLRRLESLDYLEPDLPQFQEAAESVREARALARKVGLPQLDAVCDVRSPLLGLGTAKRLLAECVGACREAAPNGPQLLPVEEVASILDISASHVYRLADGGKMPRPVKLGALVKWDRMALNDWIKAGCKSVRTIKGTR